ncbi:MAG: rhodanese-related sulfurtransferase [Candidatus Neomarinimicrobiota bacterium]
MSKMTHHETESQKIVVAAMYKFVHLPDFRVLREKLVQVCEKQSLKGTLLLAEEGINGTVAGGREGIDNLLCFLKQDSRFSDLEHKESFVSQMPFYRMKVRLKKEIVTMGIPDTDPNQLNGAKVDYKEWNELISDPDVLVIDTRNEYECEIGTFKNAISPNTKTFREFPEFVNNELGSDKNKKIAMFCTGGIRCEKATNYLLKQGYEDVYHLNGGILKYLEEVKQEENLWQGDCFVFDGRVAVDKNLEQGNYEQCFACRMPLSKEELQSEEYEKGISCPNCIASLTDEKYMRVSERQRQVELAEKRQQQHIGLSQQPGKAN